MKTPDMAKENNFVLREAAKAAQMGYYDHLAAGGKGDPAEERWIEALTAGADAITQFAVLESRLAQAERERDAAIHDMVQIVHEVDGNACVWCKNACFDELKCKECRFNNEGFEWRGVCPENTKEERKDEDCRYYTTKCSSGGGCIGTKEIDPCKGDNCERWKPKEDEQKC